MSEKRQTIADRDPWLEPHRAALERREHHYGTTLYEIEQHGGLLGPISQGHRYFGLHKGENHGRPGVWYREWAPAAECLLFTGDFNDWNRDSHPMTRDRYGVWRIFMPDGQAPVHGSKVKVHVRTAIGGMDRIPAYAQRVVQDPGTTVFAAQYWDPGPFEFQHPSPGRPRSEGLRIYEAHVGMATEEGRVGTYDEFRINMLPRIQRLGYNAVQLMAIQEHPYYGSFGYHVSSFFAVSSRCGTPEELKALIDEAHRRGLLVFLDVVHSHSVKNTNEGLYLFDGTPYQYFHEGARGHHSAWDSVLFDYSKYEVRRFLLSNVRYWLEDFRFDGFRFDGVTSMLYHHHGLGAAFNSYDDYFGGNVDDDALLYLKLANQVAHAVNPEAITIAEDVSGMPGVARPVEEWGIGFDYRLAMGVPDFWFKLVSKVRDEDWRLGDIYGMLLNRRRDEKHVAYVESHDQALVGDKTLSFWLMDQEMYWNMSNDRESLVIDRGIALHKMLRLLTFSLGGEAYLNFMGNEFGHPEWIDFPREGNGYSYHYARRQWSLAENGFLRYRGLNRFDAAMQVLDRVFGLLVDPLIEQLALHEDTRQLVYRHGPLVFCFNFHPTESFEGLRIPVPEQDDYYLLLSSDEAFFGGNDRVSPMTHFPWQPVPLYGRDQSIRIYLPSRSCLILTPQRLKAQAEAYASGLGAMYAE
jgi:1,4-alpha-glucan branching enzyme